MVPAAVVVLERLPLTVSGKLDKRALPAPEYQVSAAYRAPSGPTEEILAGIYAQVLGLERVGVDDSFFDLGGDSLTAMRVIAAINTSLDSGLAVRTLFDAPTVAGLAPHIGAGAGRRQPLAPVHRPAVVPLSFAQQRLWFLNRFEGGVATYNMPIAFRIDGDLDVAVLDSALDDVIARHESLRTVFPDLDGVAFQQVLAPEPGMWRRGGPAVVSLPESEVAGESDRVGGVSVRVVDRDPDPGAALMRWVPSSTCWGWCCTTSCSTAGRWRRWCMTWLRRMRRAGPATLRGGRRCRCSTPITRCGNRIGWGWSPIPTV